MVDKDDIYIYMTNLELEVIDNRCRIECGILVGQS